MKGKEALRRIHYIERGSPVCGASNPGPNVTSEASAATCGNCRRILSEGATRSRGQGEGGVYKDARGYWCGSVEAGKGPGGKRLRKVVRRRKKQDLLDELDKLRATARKRGGVPSADQTLEQWLTYWLTDIVPVHAKPKTAAGYRSVVKNHVIPIIGYVRLEKLTPEHVRMVHEQITAKGLSSTYALNAHNVLSASLDAALRERRISENVATMVRRPRTANTTVGAFSLPEALQVLEHVSHDPVLGARWATSLLTGARRGEVLGLERDRTVDFIDLSWQLQRLTTAEMVTLPADFERRHLTGGLYLTRPKSEKGRRVIPLFEPLRSILEAHMARTSNDYGLVFARADGQPIDPDQDTRAWRGVLAETGIDRDVPLHGLRHTTLDLLLLAEVPPDVITEILGHTKWQTSLGYKSPRNLERLGSAMEAFGALFLTQLAGTTGTRPALDA